MTTLYTAKKYAVPALESACVDFLQSNLCSDNAFLLLAQVKYAHGNYALFPYPSHLFAVLLQNQ